MNKSIKNFKKLLRNGAYCIVMVYYYVAGEHFFLSLLKSSMVKCENRE